MSEQRQFPWRAVGVVGGAAFLLLVVAPICALLVFSDQNGKDAAATPTVVDEDKFTVGIRDFAFSPSNLSMPHNSTVVWSNSDAAQHNATARDGSWATDTLDKNDDGIVRFNTPGTWEYYCTIHPYMKGVLTIR